LKWHGLTDLDAPRQVVTLAENGLKGRCSTTELRPYIVCNKFVNETPCTTLVLIVPELSLFFSS
jgi:hypothetical protein